MTNGSRTGSLLVAHNLRQALASRGMTQTFLARELDISLRAVQKWCAGDARPNSERLLQVADLLGYEPRWFFTDHELQEAA